MRKREKDWINEMEEWWRRVENMEKKMEDTDRRGVEGKAKVSTKKVRKVEERVKGMETKIEKWEEEKKRSVIRKGVKQVKGDLRWGVEQIIKDIGAEINIKKMRKIRTGREDWEDMVIIGLGSERGKRKVIEG